MKTLELFEVRIVSIVLSMDCSFFKCTFDIQIVECCTLTHNFLSQQILELNFASVSH